MRSGGHCYENFAHGNTGGVIVDLSLMNGVYVDAETGCLVIDAGATLFDVYVQLYKRHGVTLPGGSCYSVGAGGHITGGGYGLLSRLHGLTVDDLSAVEVVYVNDSGHARCDRFSADVLDSAESLMLWGNQGGGEIFGIVTKFFFADLPAAPARAFLVSESWDWENFTIIRPEPLAVPVGYHGVPAPTLDIQVLPWLFVTRNLNGSGNPRRGKYKSAHMIGNFTAAECRAVWESLRESGFQNFQALLQVDSYGGQVNAVDPTRAAIPQRSSAMKLQYQTYWVHESDDEANLRWIRDFYSAMYGGDGPVPDGRLDGCYVNYPDVDLANWKTLYYEENYPKLQWVKARWDPLNIFNHAQSIELPPIA
ncbi:MAG: BBE domain-containing protein [Pseudonocardiaceae bacterium]